MIGGQVRGRSVSLAATSKRERRPSSCVSCALVGVAVPGVTLFSMRKERTVPTVAAAAPPCAVRRRRFRSRRCLLGGWTLSCGPGGSGTTAAAPRVGKRLEASLRRNELPGLVCDWGRERFKGTAAAAVEGVLVLPLTGAAELLPGKVCDGAVDGRESLLAREGAPLPRSIVLCG